MIILDLDNCIADDAWRVRAIDYNESDLIKRYEFYHMLSSLDAIVISDELRVRNDLIIITGRPEAFRERTESWLAWHGIKPYLLIMRPALCTDASCVFKQREAQALLDDGYEIDLAYDDLPEVLEAYSAIGIKTQQLIINGERK